MKKKNVLVVGNDYGVCQMFRNKKEYNVLLGDQGTPDLVCFTGGEDVNPALYGEACLRNTTFSTSRDKQDMSYWDRYYNTPKVGICRGGQFLNVMSGGSMWQHVDNHTRNHLLINLLKTDDIDEEEIMVTSTHHQMMIAGPLGEVIAIAHSKEPDGKGLATVYHSATQKARPDFDTEVVWYSLTKSLCFQPHPEYIAYKGMTDYFFKLIDHFYKEG